MEWVAWLAALLVFGSFFMKTIVPLRILAIASNAAFIVYGLLAVQHDIFAKVLPILVLHCALLPLNLLRLHQVRSTINAVRSLRAEDGALEFLIPYMQRMQVPSGQVLFAKGDSAQQVYVLKSGQVRLLEFDKLLKPGDLFGEISIFSNDTLRTATAQCESDCELFHVHGSKILELFYQDQRFAMLIARRLAGYA